VIQYIAELRGTKADSTVKIWNEVKHNLVTFFGRHKLLQDVTVGDAERFCVWLGSQSNRRDRTRATLSDATVRRRTGICKQFWKAAAKRGYITSNPFEDQRSANLANEANHFFVPLKWAETCIHHAPCMSWRLIIALARYGGLRAPSEILCLKWADVNLPQGRMVIHAKKTIRHKSGGVRVCPIFPELRRHLEDAWEALPEGGGSEYVVTRYRGDQNLGTTFRKIIKRAGLVPWPRVFQNLRAS
jgi:integrase